MTHQDRKQRVKQPDRFSRSKVMIEGHSGPLCAGLSRLWPTVLSQSLSQETQAFPKAQISPTLFLIHINDLPVSTSQTPSAALLTTVPFTPATPFKDTPLPPNPIPLHHACLSLNYDQQILDWGSFNLVQFNSLKTQLVLFTKVYPSVTPKISFDNNILLPSSTISILGVSLS